jgi:hypothetical protein
MNSIAYMLAGLFFVHNLHICHSAVEQGTMALPMNPALFYALCGFGLLGMVLTLIAGFFRFPWYAPLLCFLLVAPAGSVCWNFSGTLGRPSHGLL